MFLSAPLKALEKRKRGRNGREADYHEKLDFQQPLAPLIESATVSISTYHAIKDHPAYHTRNLYERVAPGIADDEAYEDAAICAPSSASLQEDWST